MAIIAKSCRQSVSWFTNLLLLATKQPEHFWLGDRAKGGGGSWLLPPSPYIIRQCLRALITHSVLRTRLFVKNNTDLSATMADVEIRSVDVARGWRKRTRALVCEYAVIIVIFIIIFAGATCRYCRRLHTRVTVVRLLPVDTTLNVTLSDGCYTCVWMQFCFSNYVPRRVPTSIPTSPPDRSSRRRGVVGIFLA